MNEYILKFTNHELLILDAALKQMPYGQVAKLIENINEQISMKIAQATMVPKND